MSALLELVEPPDRHELDLLHFELPPSLEATRPPEAGGRRRDEVRLMVARRWTGNIEHATFVDLPRFLDPGDLLVVNTSATLPASVMATSHALAVHFSTPLPGATGSDLWVIELRQAGRPYRDGAPGLSLDLPGGARATLLAAYGTPGRLWIATMEGTGPFQEWLARWGAPIRYRHVPQNWPLSAYQTVFATEPGSAEMPSAARPFSAELVTALVSQGVQIAPLLLHCGVSSLEAHELPYPEHYRVPLTTADLVNATRRRGGRVIAVGTTVVRALETAVDDRGQVHPSSGWTDVVVTPGRGVGAVDGLITGWHEPEASHLAMLEAVAGRPLLERSYHEALAAGYLWHEFGDSHLILP